jgi:adenine-specific DNA methylase
MNSSVRRLIETDEMPIGVISSHARHDQNIRKGHLHTLHVWWATRPLAACRAVLLATILPDPVDERCPEDFRRKAREALAWMQSKDLSDAQELRKALLRFIGDFAAWERAREKRWVETARTLVQAAHPEGAPLVVDPFAGIGSIPFEALRIGADAYASDLNPVAVLLLKTALEYLPTYGTHLAEAVRKWGTWVRERAAEELKEFYPQEPDGSIPLAYLWARTIRCEGPGCGAEVPLVGLLWLSRKGKSRVALRYQGNKATKRVDFEIFNPQKESDVQSPMVRRFSATCPVCGYTTPYKRVREQIRAKQGGTRDARMLAVITLKPDGSRGFRLATERDVEVARWAEEALERLKREYNGSMTLVPDEPLPPDGALGFRVQKYGMETWGDLFTPRQALTLVTFARLVDEARRTMLSETQDVEFARAVTTCIGLAISNASHYSTSLSYYHPFYGMRSSFGGNGFPMKADFAEGNLLTPRLVGGFAYPLDQIGQILEQESLQLPRSATTHQVPAANIPLPDGSTPYVVTDPPYYDAVPYASMSDLCYIWLKRMLGALNPDLFRSPLTPKAEECIMDPGPPWPGEPQKTRSFFEGRIRQALETCRRVLQPDGIAVVLFAHKGTAGWEALINALVQAGWTVTGSWPIETERGARMRAKDSAVLASTVFLICRPRPDEAPVGDWRQVLASLNQRVADWLPKLAQEGIQGADAIFSCIGPALEVYSRYGRVETAGGQVIPLGDVRNGKGQVVQRGFLSFVWEVVAREALKVIFEEADPTGFEEDARLTAMWLWTLRSRANGAVQEEALEDQEAEGEAAPKKPSGYTLPYDDARLIIQSLGAHEDVLKRPGGVLEVKGDKARLVPVAERGRWLLGKEADPKAMPRRGRRAQLAFEEMAPEPEDVVHLQPGETALDRLHQAMLLFAEGRSEALRRFLVDDGAGQDDRFWRLADALSRLYPMSSQEKRWVDGVLARRRTLGL